MHEYFSGAAFGSQSGSKIEDRNLWEETEHIIKNIIYHQQRIMTTIMIMKILLNGID